MIAPRRRAILLTASLLCSAAGGAVADQTEETAMTRIRFIAGGETLYATLDDTAAARDFASLLPLELTLTDYHGIEKVADLPRQLDDSDSPRAYAPKPGDITQYRPWSNIAIFTGPFSSSAGLLRLGQFDGPMGAIGQSGAVPVRIERAE